MPGPDCSEALFRSLLADRTRFADLAGLRAWIARRNREVAVRVRPIPFSAMRDWRCDAETGDLRHVSGKFFSVEGVRVETDDGRTRRAWSQPIINQPEIGFLGIIAREFDGQLLFLMQAKIEPGNLNCVQISPTLQATRSNYLQVHRGRAPRYLEYFRNARREQILLDQLQSEQGARFLRKRNRNIIIRVDGEIDVHEDFRWMSLGQLKRLMTFDNVVNMDTRTVLSGLNASAALDRLPPARRAALLDELPDAGRRMLRSEALLQGRHSLNDLLSWLAELKSRYLLQTDRIPLNRVEHWIVGDDAIRHESGNYFRVIGVDVRIENREVSSWDQPLVEPCHHGLCALVTREFDGVPHLLFQAKLECGNFDTVELAPTVQCLTGDYDRSRVAEPPFLELVEQAAPERKRFDTMQSEEGGRFYHEQNRNLLLDAPPSFDPDRLPENFAWFTLGQAKELLRYNNFLNIQARSLIAAMDCRVP